MSIKRAVFFGASSLGAYAFSVLNRSQYEVVGFVDNFEEKWGTDFVGIPVYSPKYLLQIDKAIEIIVTSSFSEEIAKQLEKMGISSYHVFSVNVSLKQANLEEEGDGGFFNEINRIRKNFGETLSVIREFGLYPKTVVDVGVAFGTPELYRAFPDAQLIMIEPLKEFLPHMEAIKKKSKNAISIQAAATNKSGVLEMSVTSDKSTSSVLSMSRAEKRDVPAVRVDDVCTEHQLNPPYVIKVDVQGSELDVVEGCTDILEQTLAIVLEVNFFGKIYARKIPEVYEVVCRMKELGFVVYDVVGGHNRPSDGARAQADIVFVKEDGLLRKSHQWASPEQMKEFLNAKLNIPSFRDLMEGDLQKYDG